MTGSMIVKASQHYSCAGQICLCTHVLHVPACATKQLWQALPVLALVAHVHLLSLKHLDGPCLDDSASQRDQLAQVE